MAERGGPDWHTIHAIIEQRRSGDDLAIREMLEVRRRYNADWVAPLPDTQGSPTLPPIGPALIAESIDTTALMAASVKPNFFCPPLNPANERGVRSREYADVRRKILYATWHASKGSLVRRRAYRHLAGYATSCLIVRPDFGRGHPVVEIRDPLGVYPEPKAPEDLSPPRNIGFVYQRSAAWLRATYPKARREHGGPVGEPGADTEDLWDLVEWLDEECCVIGILGPCFHDNQSARWMRRTNTGTAHPEHGGPISSLELHRWCKPEPTWGRCDAITLPRVTLDRVASHLAHQIGNIDLMANLLALAIAAEEKAVFADKYAVGRDGRAPVIVSNNGVWQDGRTGKINLVKDVDQLGTLQSGAAQSALQMIDKMERNTRVSTGLPSILSGEPGSYATRTGRGIDTFVGVAVDPRVQELQEIFEAGLPHLNEIIFEQYKAYWGDKKFVMATGWAGLSGLVEFEPNRHVETVHNTVKYPILGMDAQGLTVTLGQLVNMNAISLSTLRQLHPYVDDPEMEARLAMEETLERATAEAILQQAASGQGDLVRIARIEHEMKKPGVDIFTAIDTVDKAMRKEQATPAPAPPDGMVAPPELMPGLAAQPGAPAMAPPAEVPPTTAGPNPSQQNLSALLAALEAS